MTTSLLVYRDDLGLPPMQLQNPTGGYMVIGTPLFSPFVNEIMFATPTPYFDGEQPQQVRKSNGTYVVRVQVMGDSETQYRSRVAALLAAFDQITFQVDHALVGLTDRYQCVVGQCSPDTDDGAVDESWYADYKQTWRATGGHMP